MNSEESDGNRASNGEGIRRNLGMRRRTFHTAFSTEIKHLRNFMYKYPFLTLGIAFLGGLIADGVLRAAASRFVIVALIGGPPLAMPYGSYVGLPTFLSSLLVVPIISFVAYASMRVIRAVEKHPRSEAYLIKFKDKYRPSSKFLVAHAGRLGIGGALTLSTFLVGWWVAVMIAYLLDLDISTTMKATIVGLLASSVVSWAVYEGLLTALPSPILVAVVMLIVFGVIASLIKRMADRETK